MRRLHDTATGIHVSGQRVAQPDRIGVAAYANADAQVKTA